MRFEYTFSKPVVSLPEHTPIAEAIQTLIDRNISSLLLTNAEAMVTGILTERDVIRRVPLLDVEAKMQRPVLTISTREVFFADPTHLHESLVRLHFEKRIRHFPVLRGEQPVIANVIGMVTVTDVIRYFLAMDTASKSERTQPTAPQPRPLPVLCQSPAHLGIYTDAFAAIHLVPYRVDDIANFFRDHSGSKKPLIFDLDGFQPKTLSSLIVQAQHYPGHLIMVTSNPGIVASFRPYLDKERQTIAIKPLDVEYLRWLIVRKWKAVSIEQSGSAA